MSDDAIKGSGDQDLEKSLNGPELSGERIEQPDKGDLNMNAGSSLEMGYASREPITESPSDLGMDTEGNGQIHQQSIKKSAGRGTTWG